jgi:hypothetical protein
MIGGCGKVGEPMIGEPITGEVTTGAAEPTTIPP